MPEKPIFCREDEPVASKTRPSREIAAFTASLSLQLLLLIFSFLLLLLLILLQTPQKHRKRRDLTEKCLNLEVVIQASSRVLRPAFWSSGLPLTSWVLLGTF